MFGGEFCVGDEGVEAVGSAVGGEIDGAAGKAVLGEEDWSGLECPACLGINLTHSSVSAYVCGISL